MTVKGIKLLTALMAIVTRTRWAALNFDLNWRRSFPIVQGSDFEEDGGGEAAVDMGFKIEPYVMC